jgi:predicted TIM-barrel fold metal-dependent hydrolase
MLGDQIIGIGDLLSRLPCPLVFDHMARLPQPAGAAHPAFALVAGLAQQGRAWVKLSGAYMDTKIGPPNYPDTVVLGATFAKVAPERMLWGSDWPHPTVTTGSKPDDAVLFDLLTAMVPEDAVRSRILVQNPEALYGLPAVA